MQQEELEVTRGRTYNLRPQLLFYGGLLLMQRTELVDLFLVFTANFHVLGARGSLLLFRELLCD
jgi:hypothetical protein